MYNMQTFKILIQNQVFNNVYIYYGEVQPSPLKLIPALYVVTCK